MKSKVVLCQCALHTLALKKNSPNMLTSDNHTYNKKKKSIYSTSTELVTSILMDKHLQPGVCADLDNSFLSRGAEDPLLYQNFLPAVHAISFSSVLPQREVD